MARDRYVNQNELRVIGMSRSGNHALIQWILGQLAGGYCFLNCCEGKANPFSTAREMDDGSCFQTNLDGFDLERERSGHFRDKDWLIFSHEDNFLGNACSEQFERDHDRWVGRSRRRIDLLLLRDPFNLFASRLRQSHARIGDHIAAKIWKQHARQFLEKPRRLLHAPVLVTYNEWVADAGYRRRLAEALGVPFTDRGIDRVPGCAGGSSFDGVAYDGAAGEMDVFGRWRRFAGDARYRAIFDDKLLAMSRAIFGSVGGAAEAVAGAPRTRRAARAAK